MDELNEIVGEKRKSFLKVFFMQFSDLLVIILLICAILSCILNDISSAIVIIIVLLINAVIGSIQYLESVKCVEALKKYNNIKVKKIVNGKTEIIESKYLKVNDVIELGIGEKIPADCVIIKTRGLLVNESNLTGESIGIDKTEGNEIYSSTIITKGNCIAKVTKIGMKTKIGEIAYLLNKTKKKKTPLEIKLDKLSRNLASIILIFCAIIYFVNLYRGMSILESIMFSVALSVAAIPEALGTIVTIVLSVGSRKMARNKAVVKDLMSIETLGCINVLATDKTGTITKNIMEVNSVYTFNDSMLNICLNLCINEDDPMDIAISNYINKIDYYRLKELEFNSDRKMMSTLSRYNNINYVVSKGAFEKIINNCNYYLNGKKIVKLDQNYISMITNKHDYFANSGLRVIGVSYNESNNLIETNMIFVGLVAFIDPIKDESKQAIKDLKRAGIKVLMLTGDYKQTGIKIAKDVGLLGISSDTNSDEADVFARVTPKDKIDIVTKYQNQGYVVCMSGDGINDAPALKKADVGISMGSGTDASNEASDIVLLDDNLLTISNAVKQGRGLYLNIRNAIRFLISGNLAGLLCVLYTSLLNLPMPFLAIHLLFINLLTDSIPAIAIGLEEASDDLLTLKPRKVNESIINRKLLIRIMIEGLMIFGVTIYAYTVGFNISYLKAATMSFLTMSLARLFHSLNCLLQGSVINHGIKNKLCIFSIVLGIILISLIVFIPYLQNLFMVYKLSGTDILLIYILALIPTIIIQTIKYVKEDKS